MAAACRPATTIVPLFPCCVFGLFEEEYDLLRVSYTCGAREVCEGLELRESISIRTVQPPTRFCPS
jgi:hypothetical protein